MRLTVYLLGMAAIGLFVYLAVSLSLRPHFDAVNATAAAAASIKVEDEIQVPSGWDGGGYTIRVMHDEKRHVTCWMGGHYGALACLPDKEVVR